MRKVRQVKMGNITFGDGVVRVQSMLPVPSTDIEGSVRQAKALEAAGCEIIRAAIPNEEAVALIPAIKSAVSAGYGVAFLPYMAVKKELYTKEFKIVEIPDFDLNYEIYSIYSENREDRGNTINEIIHYMVTTVNKNIC